MTSRERCWSCSVEGHISQEAHFVTKHEHMGHHSGTYPCDKPWSAGCQTDHGSLCFTGDYETQPEATQALDAHIREGKHIGTCAGDAKPVQKCRVLAGKEQNE